jgi:hypothetical protein
VIGLSDQTFPLLSRDLHELDRSGREGMTA